MNPTKKNLLLLQKKEIDLGGIEEEVARSFSNNILQYLNTWDKIDNMLDKIMSVDFRNQYLDSKGKGIIYNWHCVDHAGFSSNKRKRDLGFCKIFEHYINKINEYGNLDKIYWHFHPLSFNKEAHICNTSYDNSYDILHQILCRRLIDNNWFPIVNRAGFHAIRQDSSFFLEQWIPFDYSNQATYKQVDKQKDSNRFGDWRRAPKEWLPYHPSFSDYQSVGNMNRYTTKCLNIGTRFKLLDDYEIEMAFKTATKNGSAILSFTSHDFRDMSIDINDIYQRIHRIWSDYKDISIINSDAVHAMQKAIYNDKEIRKNAIQLISSITQEDGLDKIIVTCENGKVFGSQPYLSLKTNEGKYFHDNFSEREFPNKWEYIFDRSTFPLSVIEKISVATNDQYGNQSITSHDFIKI
jgi:hypothetical protein